MAALALRDSNLALVARSAEAWRQTVAGRWRYGAAPRGWRGSPRLDEVTLARTRRLADSGYPHRPLAPRSTPG
jgi:hypothetical protein